MKEKTETTWVEISRAALAENIATLKNLLAPGVVLAATVKANAYGHDAILAGKIFLDSGAGWLSVHALDEAIALRLSGITSPIYVLGYVCASRLTEVVIHNLDIVIYDQARLGMLANLAKQRSAKARVHLKLETGLNRQGLSLAELAPLARFASKHPFLELVGLTSHFANIEDVDNHDFARLQFQRFQEAVSLLKGEGISMPMLHMANSAAVLLYPEMHGTLVRPGIACYGIWPSEKTRLAVLAKNPEVNLRPAFTWKALTAQVKELQAGDTVGYGRAFKAERKTQLAIIPVGYYEGFDRRSADAGYVLINGKKAPLVGRVSMNNIMVDCTHCGEVRPESEVVLLGRQGDLEITAEEVASWTDRIAYEVPTRIGATLSSRIPRIIVD